MIRENCPQDRRRDRISKDALGSRMDGAENEGADDRFGVVAWVDSKVAVVHAPPKTASSLVTEITPFRFSQFALRKRCALRCGSQGQLFVEAIKAGEEKGTATSAR